MTDPDALWDAIVATDAGPLPDAIEDMPAYVTRWCQLIRQHSPLVATATDAEIGRLLANPEYWT
jgi:hypothetical protein